MKSFSFILPLVLLITISQHIASQQHDFPFLTGPYLGQKLPGNVPEIFAPGIISTGMNEFASVFSPDGKMFLYNNASGPVPAILFSVKDNGNWKKPQTALFSGRFRDYDPCFSYDGTRLYFSSDRPVKSGESIRNHVDIWYINLTADHWSYPVHLGDSINSDANEYYPCLTKNNNLYFSSGRKGGFGANDIYVCRFYNGRYLLPENLGENINSSNFEGDVFISPDESYMIVTCYNRPDGYGSGDLYISFRDKQGGWTRLKNMGSSINSYANEHCPMVTPDSEYFFFTSYRNTGGIPLPQALTFDSIQDMQSKPGNGRGDIYWVSTNIIKKLRPKE